MYMYIVHIHVYVHVHVRVCLNCSYNDMNRNTVGLTKFGYTCSSAVWSYFSYMYIHVHVIKLSMPYIWAPSLTV